MDPRTARHTTEETLLERSVDSCVLRLRTVRSLLLVAVCLLIGCYSGEQELPIDGSVMTYQGSWE